MKLLTEILSLPAYLHLIAGQIDSQSLSLKFTIASSREKASCPICQELSAQVHSHYERTLADLCWGVYALSWKLWVRKFFCRNSVCPRKVFTERLPQIVTPHARKTERLIEQQTKIALALGGKAGERLSDHLNYSVSRQTLLSFVSRLPVPSIKEVTVLGVDDWAYRKGKTYGTILVDLEKRRPIALLPNREAETLSQWLKEHPGVKIVTRDRSSTYKQGITQGSPESLQVADRFHILQNLAEALEGVFNEHLRELKTVDEPPPRVLPEAPKPLVSLPPPEREKADIVHSQACRTRRLVNYNRTHELHRQGWTNRAIASQIGISQRTVRRFLLHRTFPERRENCNRGHSRLDPYKTYLLERWNSGCHHSKLLWREVAAMGCRSSYGSVARFLRSLKEAQGLKVSPDARVLISRRPQLTPRRAAWLVLRRSERRSEEDEDLLARLRFCCPALEEAIALACEFVRMSREQSPEGFDSWLVQGSKSSSGSLVRFANGLREDYEAVKAALTLPWSNGQVEGQVNRLKMVKRQMYGRASFSLLNQRVLLAS